MGLEAVLEEIREKGKKEADAIRAESTADSDRILAEANRKVGGIKTEAGEASAKQASRMIAQEISAANLLVKREILNTQKGLLDDVYEGTRKEIAKLLRASIAKPSKNSLQKQKRRSPGAVSTVTHVM